MKKMLIFLTMLTSMAMMLSPFAAASADTAEPPTAMEKPTETQLPTDYADDVAPKTDYDGTPMTVGETRRIHLSHRFGRRLTNVFVQENYRYTKGFLDWEFDEDTSDLVVTALKATDSLMVDIGARECAFTQHFTMQILEASTDTTLLAAEQKPGDLNADGTADIMDVILLNKHILGVKKLDADAEKAADMNGDGTLDSADSLALLKTALGILEKQDPVEGGTVELSKKFSAQPVKTVAVDEKIILGQTKFALDLLRETAKETPGKNVLVSPYSVSQALGMTANGAKGDTLKEMETVLGGSMDKLNAAFYTFRTQTPSTDGAKLSTANSIWVKQGYHVWDDFLQTNADYYAADAFAAPFDDSTKDDINGWVNEKTDKMIPQILDKIPEDARLYLVNAVAFDAKWMKVYNKNQIDSGKFNAPSGKQDVQMLHGEEYSYLSDSHATGFLKMYKGGNYAFAAILPEESMTPDEYLAVVTPDSLHTMLSKPENTKVNTTMPEFAYDFGTLLNDPLKQMGMELPFDNEYADFSGMSDDPDGLCISRVIHKTRIEVSSGGTRAGAATVVEMATECATEPPADPKNVVLDRPFVYAIVDTNTNLPIFIGIVNSVEPVES